MIQTIAEIYVEYVEPGLKLGAFLVLLVVVAQILGVIQGKPPSRLVAYLYDVLISWSKSLFSGFSWFVRGSWAWVLWVVKSIVLSIREFWAMKN